jgi:putative ABC transport system permease protein
MLLNYLKIALRTMLRYKSFSVINILGLTIGLTAFLGISLYVADELSFDSFHENKDRIYRSLTSAEWDGRTVKWGGSPNLLAPTAMKEIPEVEKATRYFHHNFGSMAFVSTETENFTEQNLYFADPEFLDIFTLPIIKGAARAKLIDRPGTVIISERAAEKYFDTSDPIGKVLTIDNNMKLEVTGVYKTLPANSFFQAEMIASFSSNWFGQDRNQSWGNASFDSFFLLHEGVSQDAAYEKMTAMLLKNVPADRQWFKISLQPLSDIRLHSGDLDPTADRRVYGDYKQVKILIGLATIILLIASVNYMNLSTAQSQRRNKEVGIVKTLGGTFSQLTRRFYLEASVFVGASLLISLAAFGFLLPMFNALSGKAITMEFISSSWFWLGFISIWIILTVLAGLYPALYLSSFSPKLVLQKTSASGSQAFMRKGLVVFQFSVSIILIICSVVFYQQMNFIRNKKLGYQPEQVVAVMTTPVKDRDQAVSLKTSYEALGDVVSVSRTQSYPGMSTSSRNILRDGESEESGGGSLLLTMRATHEILSVLNIKLLAGKTLPETKDPNDTTVQVVVNKATVDYLGLSPEEAIGKRVNIQGFNEMTDIVGVTEDFHFTTLRQQISPFCFHNSTQTESYSYLLVKVNTANLSGTIKQLENIYTKNVAASFEYTFLDQHLNSLYRAEQNLGRVVMVFAGLAIFVACLGLYALAAFTAEQRTKEIGIRKVLGASVSHVVGMLSRDFMILVIIAFVIGIPVGYYMMDKWLESFAYKTDITVVVFLSAGLISMLIAGVTVSFESFRAARTNPVESLRSE